MKTRNFPQKKDIRRRVALAQVMERVKVYGTAGEDFKQE